MTRYRRAWTMELQEGAEAAYDAAHAAIWPELRTQMEAGGVKRYYLFRSGTTVFAFQERTTPFPTKDHPVSEVMKRWWAEMAPLMQTGDDNRPIHTNLSEIFAFESTLETT